MWDVHGLRTPMRSAWEAGVVLAGVSAGAICWYVGGCTDSFGPELRAVTNGLGLLPYGCGVHYDSEEARRPTIHGLVADGTLPETHCTDDGVGLVYRGTELVEAVSDATARGPTSSPVTANGIHEERVEPRQAPGRLTAQRCGVSTTTTRSPAAEMRAASITASVCTASQGSTGMAPCGSSDVEGGHHRPVEVRLGRRGALDRLPHAAAVQPAGLRRISVRLSAPGMELPGEVGEDVGRLGAQQPDPRPGAPDREVAPRCETTPLLWRQTRKASSSAGVVLAATVANTVATEPKSCTAASTRCVWRSSRMPPPSAGLRFSRQRSLGTGRHRSHLIS